MTFTEWAWLQVGLWVDHRTALVLLALAREADRTGDAVVTLSDAQLADRTGMTRGMAAKAVEQVVAVELVSSQTRYDTRTGVRLPDERELHRERFLRHLAT